MQGLWELCGKLPDFPSASTYTVQSQGRVILGLLLTIPVFSGTWCRLRSLLSVNVFSLPYTITRWIADSKTGNQPFRDQLIAIINYLNFLQYLREFHYGNLHVYIYNSMGLLN